MNLYSKGRVHRLDVPVVMGVLNVTPDSFSDGGLYQKFDAAVTHARLMLAEGAAIIDIGGESTRPGAQAVGAAQELARTLPVIEALRADTDALISIDTSKPAVMREACAAGADIINDVRALREPGALDAAAESGAAVCLMHMQGQPRTMQQNPSYKDVVAQVYEFLAMRVAACIAAGIRRESIIIDPGFGFGKTLQHNLQLLADLSAFKDLELPILVGFSRKSMFRDLLCRDDTTQRLPASLAAAALAVCQGAKIARSHDVAATYDAIALASAVAEVGG